VSPARLRSFPNQALARLARRAPASRGSPGLFACEVLDAAGAAISMRGVPPLWSARHVPRSPIPHGRPRPRGAHKFWRIARGDPKLAALCDRAWSETLLAVEQTADPARAELMFARTQLLFEFLLDRRGWPTVVHGLRRPS
jgi:hypothetical protein